MKTNTSPIVRWMILLSAAMIYVGPLAPSALAQFQWSQRIASAGSLPEGELNTGLALDTNANCYVTGWFDGTNNFGGITLTNQSTGGGSDIFVAKYNASGALQWVQQAGQSAGNTNYGRAVGVDTNGNVYVTGSAYGSATFGSTNLTGSSGQNFFLAKYNNAGAVQWVKPSSGGSSDVYGIGLAVDGAGNSYAMVTIDHSAEASISFGSTTVPIPAGENWPFGVLVKYDNNGTIKWTQLLSTSEEVYAPTVALDTAGNIYLHGIFVSSLTIGTSNLTASDSLKHLFIAKLSNSGNVTWIQQPQSPGNGMSDGGVAVDPAGNVFVSGAFNSNLNFGTNLNGTAIILTNMANSSASFGDAFLAKYNSAGVIQWAQAAGGANGGYYMDIALDAQTNIYAAGGLVSGASVSKYSPAGTLLGTYAANGPPANPVGSVVAKCAVDAAGHCYVDGIYQGTTAFGTNALQPQEAWNFFLAETMTNSTPVVLFTASPTSGVQPLTVLFNSPNVDSQGNAITSWNWNFGDGAVTNLQNPPHTYVTVGNYTPVLTATNNKGAAVIAFGPGIVISPLPFTVNTNNGSITITAYVGPGGAVVIPTNIYNYPVTGIGDGAFSNCVNVTSITIPNSVTSIGNYAFYECFNLTNVMIQGGSIGDYGFCDCTSLASAAIQGGAIGDYAFFNCYSLTNVTLGTNVTSIGAYAFSGDNGEGDPLSSITIPNSVTSIGTNAFFDCYYLTSAVIQGGTISADAFSGCASLASVTLGTNVTSIGANAFFFNTRLTSITIPKSVTNIGTNAFSDCNSLSSATIQGGAIGAYAFNLLSLTNVTLGTNVTSIGAYAFSDTSLTSITIPNSVTSIGEGAFFDCTSLTNVTLGTNVTSIGDYAFSGNNDMVSYEGDPMSSITIPNSVTSIGAYAFYGVRVTNLTLGTNLTSIGAYAFSGFFAGAPLSSVTIPNSVTNIGNHAFYDCTSLTNVTLGTNLTNIGAYAFSDSSLISITIPNSVTSIGTNAFYDCASLTSATIQGGAVGAAAFYYCTSLTNVMLGTNVTSIGAYAFSGGYYYYNTYYQSNMYDYVGDPLSSVIIPNSVTNIGDYAFYDCTSLTNVTLGTNVTSIGDYAFCGTRLTGITIPNRVTTIGDYAFSGTSLTSITIPNRVTSIGAAAFFGCTRLTSATILGGAIGDSAFGDCTSLTIVTLGTNVTSIGDYAFYGYNNNAPYSEGDPLSSITIPNSVTNIGDNAFYDCNILTVISVDTQNADYSSLNGVLFDKHQITLILYPGGQIGSYTISSNITSIGDYAFSYTRLMSITIPNTITNIGDYAFYDCTSLTNVTLGTNLTSIGAYAFSDSSLISITIPNSVASIGTNTFDGCASLTSAMIQGGAIGDSAFYNCYNLANVTFGSNVTSIGDYAFSGDIPEGDPLSSITIPNNVTNMGDYAFSDCKSLANVTLGTSLIRIGAYAFSSCNSLTSITIPNRVTSIGDSAFYYTSLTSIIIPNSVTSIGDYAFSVTSLTNVTIPGDVTNIGEYAFSYCYSLNQAYFQGNASTVDGQPGSADSTVFSGESGTAYYLPGTTGWGATFGGWPTAGWYQPQPTILGNGYGLGVRSNRFGFTISWATNISVVVQATTNLANPVWAPLATNPLVGGTNYFSDPKWTNYPRRFYRITTP